MNDETFIDTHDGVIRGKGISALKGSRASRSQLIALFGGTQNLPSSVMKIERTRGGEQDEITEKYSYTSTMYQLGAEKIKELGSKNARAFAVSGKGCAKGALSHFPQNIGRTVLLFYSDPGDLVVDPFAGHNSRMELCVRELRNYVGFDLSKEFMVFNRKRADFLRKEFPGVSISLHEGDSRVLPVNDGIGDFTITSPPYWDIEYYGDEEAQMGKCKTYKKFLKSMSLVVKENFRTLKPGAFSVWFVNDFRRKGVFHSYHSDIIRLGMDAGFLHHDLLIVDFGPGIRDVFLNQAVDQQILPKRHEFGVVFKKPETKAAI